MRYEAKYIIATLAILAVLLIGLGLLWRWLYQETRLLEVQALQYRGDGTLRNVVRSPFRVGYEIKFEDFSLDEPYDAKYSLEALPTLDRYVQVNLVVPAPNDSEKVMSIERGTLQIALEGSGETSILLDNSVHELTFAETSNAYFIYSLDDNVDRYFNPPELREIEKLQLRVHYIPPEDAQSLPIGYFRIRVGGVY